MTNIAPTRIVVGPRPPVLTPDPVAPPVERQATVPARRAAPALRKQGWWATRRQRLADTLANHWLGTEQPSYRGQLTGPIGRIANRLAPGQGVLLSGLGMATVPAGLLAAWLPGGLALPDAGASLRVAGLMVRRRDGKLLVTLTFQASESAAYSLGTELATGVQFGERTLGFKLGAEGSLGAETSQGVVVALRFDPQDPADARRLEHLLSLGSAGGGPQLAAQAALAQAMKRNRVYTSVGGSVGVNANATAGGTAGAPKPGGQGIAKDTPWQIKAKLGLTGAANIDAYRTYGRDGSLSDTVAVEGDLDGALKLPQWVSGKLTNRNAAGFSATYGPDGQLSDLAGMFTHVQVARALLDRFALNPGAKIATKTIITRSLNARGLEQARKLIAAGVTPLAAYRTLARDSALIEERRANTDARSFLLGFSFDAAFVGHKAHLQATLAAGKIERHASDDGEPGLRETLMLMAGTPTGGNI